MLIIKKAIQGMTLMSVLVATALSAVIGLMVIRLMVNQSEAMLMISLSEEREILVKHYRQVVIGGWDRTMGSGAGIAYTRTGRAFPFSLGENLYNPLASGSGWWEIDATIGSTASGKIQHSDAYDSSGRGLATEQNYTVTLKVDFDPTKHPVASMDIATREEIIYMGYRWQQTKQSGCGSDSATALTRRDTTGGTPKTIYHPNSQGAVVSYSFHSNYVKCSQVPLVSNASECSRVSAILGFESRGTGTTDNPFYRRAHSTNEHVTGRLACSYPLATTTSGSAWKTALGNERYYTLHNKVWAGTASSTGCSSLDKSYVDSVTAIGTGGTGGGELTCDPTLIAPQVFNHYYDRGSRRNSPSVSGSALGVNSGSIGRCISYWSYDGGGRSSRYDDHVGKAGYNVKHSGGLTNFVSTGLGSGARTDPFRAKYNSRGVPGDRGEPGDCICGSP